MADFEFKAPTARRSMIRTVVAGVVALILVAILIWAIVRHFQKQPDSEGPANLPETSQNDGADNEPTAPSDTTGDAGQDNSADTSDDAVNGADNETNAEEQAERELADTGPGDTLAIFIGSALLGGLAYQVYVRRQLARR